MFFLFCNHYQEKESKLSKHDSVNFTEFIGKYLCWNLFLTKIAGHTAALTGCLRNF